MQLLPRDFHDLTWGQYNCRVRGWLRQQDEQWEHTRTLYALHYNMLAKEPKTAQQLIPLRKDAVRVLELQTPAFDREALIAKIKKRDNLQ